MSLHRFHKGKFYPYSQDLTLALNLTLGLYPLRAWDAWLRSILGMTSCSWVKVLQTTVVG